MAKSSTPKVDLSNIALEILEPDSKQYAWTLRLIPSQWDAENRRWRGVCSYGDTRHLANLRLRCYQSPEHPERETYSWYTEYTEAYSIDTSQAESMYKMLSQVDKGLEKARERDGSCTTFGHYVLRVCRALGIQKVIRKNVHYSGEYQHLSVAEGQYAVDNLIFTWRESMKSAAAD